MQRVSPYSQQSLDGSSPGLNIQLQHKEGSSWGLLAYTSTSPLIPTARHQNTNLPYQGQIMMSLPRMGR